MSQARTLVHPEEAILVLGSLNSNHQDRLVERAAIQPVQVILDGTVLPLSYFDSWGELGVSSVAWHPQRPLVLYVTTGCDLTKVDLIGRRVSRIEVVNLRDVHEMTVVGDTLWLANTGLDEAIAFDTTEEQVIKRTRLTARGPAAKIATREVGSGEGELRVVDKFHCNQIFQGFDRELYALVHHVSGRQLIRRIARKLTKGQGNGGVLCMTSGTVVPLELSGPHSVRKVGGRYWVFDSGRATIGVYDPTWVLEETILVNGWGRGADVSASSGLFYAGISATRRRYLETGSSGYQNLNSIQAISIEDGTFVGEIDVPNVEQINNVYVISRVTAAALLGLSDADTVND